MEKCEQRSRIALQISGRLTDHSLDLRARCGLKFSQGKDQLICYGENMPVDLLMARDDDIPGLVFDDVCDPGVVGLSVIRGNSLTWESNGKSTGIEQVYVLDFGHCRLSIAAPESSEYRGLQSLQNSRIATSYTGNT